MRPADSMKKLFEQARLDIRPDDDERVFCDVLRAQREKTNQPKVRIFEGRFTMKNPIAKLAVAAAVVVACIVGVFMWTGTQSSVALADVLTRLQQVNAYMYQMTATITGSLPSGEPLNQEMNLTALMSDELGMKMTMEMETPMSGADSLPAMDQEVYMLPAQRKMVTIMPGQKKYMQIDFDDTLFEQQRKEKNDPRTMVQQILKSDYVSLGRSTIDGIEVEGFQTTDPNYMGAMMGEINVKIWVDVKTQLPIRSEMDMQASNDMHMHMVMDGFAWDVSVDASEFEPVIPEDFTTVTSQPMKIPAMNEETALQGLKTFAELTGRYPEKLDIMTLMSVTKDLAKADGAEIGAASDPEAAARQKDEYVAKVQEKLMPIMSISRFYTTLVQDQKHPAYYGDVVGPEDAAQVLMRWQVSETEYRVVFGSLHTETVSAEVLAELEKTLPKP
jgi:outer membrane lipoprotein-sorting protein